MRNRLTASLAALGLLLAACSGSTDGDHDTEHGAAGTPSSGAGTNAVGAAGRGSAGASVGGTSAAGMTSTGGTASGVAGRTATAGTSGGAGAPSGGNGGAGGSEGGSSAGGDGGIGTGGSEMGGTAAGGRTSMGGRSAMGGRMSMGGLGGSSGGGQAMAGTFSVWTGGASGTTDCPANGHITYTLTKSANPSATEQMYYDLITQAMDKAIAYYNCYTNLSKAETVTYNSGVDTADGNSNGSIRFGGKDYMEYITAMHEIAHTLGVGTVPQWGGFIVNGIFTGEHATAQLRAITGKADDQVHGDTQHFWPYGLNYTSEVMSEADVIDHCYMVVAIRADMELD